MAKKYTAVDQNGNKTTITKDPSVFAQVFSVGILLFIIWLVLKAIF